MESLATTILLVDSAAQSREAVAQAFRGRGHQVFEARDAMAAFATLARADVGLVLIDVSVRGGGLDMLRTIRCNRSAVELPVVMLTERPDQLDAVEALEAGANDCIGKPVAPPVVLARVEAQLKLHTAATGRKLPAPAAVAPSAAAPVAPVAPPPAPAAAPPPEAAAPAPAEIPLSPNRLGPGTLLAGKYQLESKIGTGSFGTVWKATHLDLATGVAVKVLQRELAATDARGRLQREAISACRIQHPNAVSVTDFGIQGEVVYLVMELLTGRTLEDELALGGRMSVARAIEIVVPVLSVLAAAHATGIIHRDVKPANIFLHHTPRGEVIKVLDFGIAKLLDAPQMTSVGVVLGTPAFMAPERFTSGTSDPSGDVYSLATMLFQMITGRLPFMPESPDPIALAEMKVKQEPPPPRTIVSEIPEAIEALVLRALSRSPGSRPSAAELAAGLVQAAPQGASSGSTLSDSDTAMDIAPEATAVMPLASIPTEPKNEPAAGTATESGDEATSADAAAEPAAAAADQGLAKPEAD